MLKPNQQQALTLLLAGNTATDAAKAVGVTRQTVSEWKRLPAFRDALEAAAAEQAHEVLDTTMGAWRAAVRLLDAIVRNDVMPALSDAEDKKGAGWPLPMRLDAARMVLAAGSRIAAAAVVNARRQSEESVGVVGLAELVREAQRARDVDPEGGIPTSAAAEE